MISNLPNATLYPKGHILKDNDSSWIVVVNHNGCHKWKRNDKTYLEKVGSSIDGMKLLMENNPDEIENLQNKINAKILCLELVDDDDELNDAKKLYTNFIVESMKYGGKINKINESIKIYEKALSNTKDIQSKKVLANKIVELKNQI